MPWNRDSNQKNCPKYGESLPHLETSSPWVGRLHAQCARSADTPSIARAAVGALRFLHPRPPVPGKGLSMTDADVHIGMK